MLLVTIIYYLSLNKGVNTKWVLCLFFPFSTFGCPGGTSCFLLPKAATLPIDTPCYGIKRSKAYNGPLFNHPKVCLVFTMRCTVGSASSPGQNPDPSRLFRLGSQRPALSSNIEESSAPAVDDPRRVASTTEAAGGGPEDRRVAERCGGPSSARWRRLVGGKEKGWKEESTARHRAW